MKSTGRGIGQIRGHSKGKYHMSLLKQISSQPDINTALHSHTSISNITTVNADPNSLPNTTVTSETNSGNKEIASILNQLNSNVNQVIPRHEIRDAVTRAEIYYSFKIIYSHSSVRSCDHVGDMFRKMFYDSEIAREFRMAKAKVAYLINYGLGPYYEAQNNKIMEQSDLIVVQFDESLNKVVQRGQMDVHIRYIDDSGMVQTKYITSAFLGHATAENLMNALKKCLPDKYLQKTVQFSMDGPAVNWKLLDLFKDEFSDNNTKLVEIGSCGIDVMHGAFKTGFKKSKWYIDEFIRATYYVFKNSPARRADFIEVTKSTSFPKQFVGTRWLENALVAQHLLTLLVHLKIYVEAVKTKAIHTTKSKSFERMAIELENIPLLRARLEFFSVIATELEPFLKDYQGNEPLSPFLYARLQTILKNLLQRFIKKQFVDSLASGKDFAKLDIKSNSVLLPVREIDIGFGAKRALHGKNVPSQTTINHAVSFRADCREILQTIIGKIQERSPLKYRMTKFISALDPTLICSRHRFSKMCDELIDAGRITTTSADRALLS